MLKRMFLLGAMLAGALLLAGDPYFQGKCDKNLLYQPGEPATFTLTAFDGDGKPMTVPLVKYTIAADGGYKKSGELRPTAPEIVISTVAPDQPGFLRLVATACSEDGKPMKTRMNYWGNMRTVDLAFDGGLAVEPEKIAQAVPEPADFDAFWAKQKQELAKTPLKVLEKKEVPSKDPAVVIYDVKIACPGKRPVSGILTMPKDAKEKSLSAVVLFHGYGVTGSGPRMDSGKTQIVFDINAHGIENRREASYYNDLKNGELKGYALSASENENPENSYFKGMLMRLMRGLEFVKSLPEWNGKDFTVSGGSQGGFQAIAAAALDHDVTWCNAGVPWMANLGGVTKGRMGGFQPTWTPGLGYYDTANFAKRVKCPVAITTGTADYTCPPSSVMVVYNNISAPAKVEIWQAANHTHNRQHSLQHVTFEKNK